jgi:hypothetical protein
MDWIESLPAKLQISGRLDFVERVTVSRVPVPRLAARETAGEQH